MVFIVQPGGSSPKMLDVTGHYFVEAVQALQSAGKHCPLVVSPVAFIPKDGVSGKTDVFFLLTGFDRIGYALLRGLVGVTDLLVPGL